MADDHRLLSSFAEHRSALLRFLRRRLGNAALAEDLTQETWLRAANARGAAAIDNPRGYLFSIASNLALDHQRHVGHRVELQAVAEVVEAVADHQPSPENVVLYRSEFARLLRVVDQLSPRCREVFVLGKFEGLSLAEISQRLGISRNTVVTHMVNALAAIEREMASDT
ncbi:MAG: RNA polymerase sigma factor [Alphaproteobacteria bacterium]|nr:RNA polymerase sigma factor [Alphaproteobacteria bacterium]